MPKKGIYVTDVTLNDVLQIFQTRLEIEPVTLRMAGPVLPQEELINFRDSFWREEHEQCSGFRLDTAMHLFIIEHCGNRFIIDMMRKVFDENTRVIISTKQNETKIHDARLEHLEILDLLIKKDFASAQKSIYAHITNCRRAALDYFYNLQTIAFHPATTYQNQLNNGVLGLNKI